MNTELKMVREFQTKYNSATNVALPEHVNVELQMIADRLDAFAVQLEGRLETTADPRVLRAQLMCEELGETLTAMAQGDEVQLLDGLTDLLYVVFGTAITFDMPVEKAFPEVHKSNMTKQRVLEGRAADVKRIRTKGDEWQPPDLAYILAEHRL